MHQHPTVHLPVYKEDGTSNSTEELEVEQLGENHFRLIYSPGVVDGLAGGDEFALTKSDRLGYTIIKRSGNLCVWFYFSKQGQNRGPAAADVRAQVEQIGGWCDGGMNYLLVFTIPVSRGFHVIEPLFDSLVKQHPGSTWFYGNVYDPIDGQTPLRWWEPT